MAYSPPLLTKEFWPKTIAGTAAMSDNQQTTFLLPHSEKNIIRLAAIASPFVGPSPAAASSTAARTA